MDWGYKREDAPSGENFVGKRRCVIVDVDGEAVSKNTGLPMIVVTVRPSGSTFKVRTWLVKNEYFNRNATQFFNAFPEIGDGNFNFIEWIGAMGAANFTLDDGGYLKVKSWVYPKQAESLPAFEGQRPERQTVTSIVDPGESGAEEDDLPWV